MLIQNLREISAVSIIFFLTLCLSRADTIPKTVTITQKAILLILSPNGEVVDLTESKVGKCYLLVDVEDQQVTLQDTKGIRYRIVRDATDYHSKDLMTRASPQGETPTAVPFTTPASLNLMVSDHPEILQAIKRDDEIWKWLAIRFYNDGHPIIWSSHNPIMPTQYVSSHTYSVDGTPILMLAKHMPDGSSITPEKALASIIFEVFNSGHKIEFMEVEHEALQRKLSRPEFIRLMAQIEHKTALQLKDFYAQMWLPYAIKTHLHFDGNNWQMGASEDFEQWLYYYKRTQDGYPENIYGPYYDILIR